MRFCGSDSRIPFITALQRQKPSCLQQNGTKITVHTYFAIVPLLALRLNLQQQALSWKLHFSSAILYCGDN